MFDYPHLHTVGEQPPPTHLTHTVAWGCRPCRVAFMAAVLRGRYPHPSTIHNHIAKGREWLTLDYDPRLAQALDALDRHLAREGVAA